MKKLVVLLTLSSYFLLNSMIAQTAVGGCSSVLISSQLFHEKLIENANIIDEISPCEKVVDVPAWGWGHARIWLQKKNSSGVFEDYNLEPVRARVAVSQFSPLTFGETKFVNLPHGTYRGKVQVPVNYNASCGLIIYHSIVKYNIGWQAVMSPFFFTSQVIVGQTISTDIAYSFVDGGGGDANPNAFDFGEIVTIDPTASKNYDQFWLAIFELSGEHRYFSQGWTIGSTLGVTDLSQKWATSGNPPWVFESLGSYRVQFAIENSKCGNASWTGMDKDFFICPAGSGCRFADEAYSNMRLSPNPAAGNFQLLGWDASAHPASRLVLSDLSGREVKSESAVLGEMDISELPDGMYVVTLWDNTTRLFSDKLVIRQ